MNNDKTTWEFNLQRIGQKLQTLWSLLSVSLLIFKFCPPPHFSFLTNASLCCHSTSRYQTSSLSHLFILSWEPCLSLYSLYIILSYFSLSSPGVSCHLLCSQWYILEQTTERWQCNMDGVKMNIDTGGSRIFLWQRNASVACKVQGCFPNNRLIKTWNVNTVCLCVSFGVLLCI